MTKINLNLNMTLCNSLYGSWRMTSYLQHSGESADLIHIAEEDGLDDFDGKVDRDESQIMVDNKKIVGYVMANIVRSPMDNKQTTPAITSSIWKKKKNMTQLEGHGHITSIAVLSAYRRHGIAQRLIAEVHDRMQRFPRLVARCPPITCSMLHVRVGNTAAVECYRKLNYEVKETVGFYYQDGEAAFQMVCNFTKAQSADSTMLGGGALLT